MYRRRLSLLALALLLAIPACRRSRITPFGGLAFVAADRGISVVDLESFSLAARIPLQSQPLQIAADPARRRLYVMGEGGAAGLTILDAATWQPLRTFWLGEQPLRFRLSADNQRLYALEAHRRRLRVFDLEPLQERGEIPLGGVPVDFDITPDGRWACISLGHGEAEILDLEARRVAGSAPVGRDPGPVAIRYDGRQAFIANRAARSIAILEIPSGRLLTNLALGAEPGTLRFKPDGGELFVSGADRSTVVIISAYRNEIDQPLLAGSAPNDMAVTRDNQLLFVANGGANTVSVVDIGDRRTIAAVPVGLEPRRVVLTPDDEWALVLNYGSGDMALIRRRGVQQGRERVRPLFSMIPVGSRPVDVAVLAR
jgi:YVTN family beta-propeller protein